MHVAILFYMYLSQLVERFTGHVCLHRALTFSPLAKHANPEMFFTASFFIGNVMYMVWGVNKCRMLICILWAIFIIKLINIFN